MTAALNPGTARRFCTGCVGTRTGGLLKYRVSIPGRVWREHKVEMPEVNALSPESLKKLNVSAQKPGPSVSSAMGRADHGPRPRPGTGAAVATAGTRHGVILNHR